MYLLTIPEIPAANYQNLNQAVDLPCVTASVLFLKDLAKLLVHYETLCMHWFEYLLILCSMIFMCNKISYAPVFSPETANELQCYLTTMIPFGVPIETNPKIVKALHYNTLSTKDVLEDKRPAWKPFVYTGRSEVVEINIIECIHGGTRILIMYITNLYI